MTTNNAPTITRTSPACMFCSKTSRVELTAAQARAIDAGTPIHDALPDMPAAQRELLISGIHPDCWTNAFG